jgi:uncharacterized membrane protein
MHNSRNNNQRRNSHQNPHNILPSPSVLEEYESISPDSVDRLLDMAQKEQDHRHSWQEKHLNVHARIYKWGQIFALLYNIALLALVGSLIKDGNQELAVKLFVINATLMVFALLVTFVERRIMNRRPPRRLPKKYNNNHGNDNKNRK